VTRGSRDHRALGAAPVASVWIVSVFVLSLRIVDLSAGLLGCVHG
jgi:hypothetical protein